MPVEFRQARDGQPPLEIHRSPRRHRTSSATVRDGTIVVRIPASLPTAESAALIDRLVGRVLRTEQAHRRGGDEALFDRACILADRHTEGRYPVSVRWSSRMTQRYGSCSVQDKSIRISTRLASAPARVLDYVLVHELAHLHYADHSAAFWNVVNRFEGAQWAQGWLDGHRAGMAAVWQAPPVASTD